MIVHLVVFFVSVQKVQNINKNACRQMFKSLKPFRKEVAVDEPSKDNTIVVLKFFISHQKYQHQEPLQDLGIPSMIIDQFWEMMTKIIMNLSMESHLLQNKCMQN
jgi:hypothetical protein